MSMKSWTVGVCTPRVNQDFNITDICDFQANIDFDHSWLGIHCVLSLWLIDHDLSDYPPIILLDEG